MASIVLNWSAPGGTISGYNVYRGSALGNESPTPLNGSLIPSGTTTYTDTTAVAGQTYSYAVKSVYNGVLSAATELLITAPFGASPSQLNLGLAASFGVLASSTITNTGTTTITGDVGTSPGTSITGLTSAMYTGNLYSNTANSTNAQTAALAAYNAGVALGGATTLAADIGGETLTTGVYNSASSLAITGTLTLDAQGNRNAVWIFQIGSTLTTAVTNSTVLLVNGAQASNIFWLVGSSATLNATTTFAGNIIAHTSITVGAGVTVNGKLMALTGAVTLDADTLLTATVGSFVYYDYATQYSIGEFLFQDNDGHFQECIVAGTSGNTVPVFSPTVGGTTVDGTVTWLTVSPASITIIAPPVPSIPAVPGAPGSLT